AEIRLPSLRERGCPWLIRQAVWHIQPKIECERRPADFGAAVEEPACLGRARQTPGRVPNPRKNGVPVWQSRRRCCEIGAAVGFLRRVGGRIVQPLTACCARRSDHYKKEQYPKTRCERLA